MTAHPPFAAADRLDPALLQQRQQLCDDPIAVAELQNIIRRLKDQGIGILITDHNVRETLQITDRTYIIREGKILESGSAREIASSPIARKYYLGEKFVLDQ